MATNTLVEWLDVVCRKHGLDSSSVAGEQDTAADATVQDAESDLESEYASLGGDEALGRVLADEDKLFRANTEALRAHVKKWQKEQRQKLDERKKTVDDVLKEEDGLQAPLKAWLEREKPAAGPVTAEVKALGPKLATERGKEVLNEVNVHNAKIREVEIAIEYNSKSFERHRSLFEILEKRYADVDGVYEAFEKIVGDARTELDNHLQMKAMSLKDKLAFLKDKPKLFTERLKQAKASLAEITKGSIAATMCEEAKFEPSDGPYQAPPIDWAAIKAKLAAVKAASLEDLKQVDPALAKLREAYEKAGGDEALFKKRVAAWKKEVAGREEADKRKSEEYQKRADELQETAAIAARNHERNETSLGELKERIGQITPRLEELKGKAELSPREDAEQKLLVSELKRVRSEVANKETLVKASAESKKNAKELIEQERRRYETLSDDDPRFELHQKPQSSDIESMPLRAKHAELTGK